MTLDEALRAIDAGDPDGVAVLLYALDVRGVRYSACGCPVANAASQMVGFPVAVNPEMGAIDRYSSDASRVALPAAVKRFANAFDNGEYPELEVA